MKTTTLLAIIMAVFSFNIVYSCDGLVPVVASNTYIGNGQYLLEVEFCEEVTNGSTLNGVLTDNANIFGLIITVNGANIIGINTPSLTGVSSGTTVFPTQTAPNQVEYGDWGNPSAPVLLEYGDPQECWTIYFVVDGPASTVDVWGSSFVGATQPGFGMTNNNGIWGCGSGIAVPPVTCNSDWTPPLFCQGSTTTIDLNLTTQNSGVFSGTGVNSQTGFFDPTGLSGPVAITLTVGDAFLSCSTTYNITPVVLAPPILSDQTICDGDSVNLDATVVVAGGCDYTLELYDSYGDGWNGADIDIYINGVLYLSNQTVANCGGASCTNVISIPLMDGDVITLNYSGGTFDNENTVTLFDSNGGQVTSISDPPNGWLGSGVTASCSGGTLTYSWSPVNGLSDPSSPTPIATPTVTTTYTVDVSSPSLGCSTQTPVTITVVNCPPVEVCNDGGTLIASGGLGGPYTWQETVTITTNTPINTEADCLACGGTPSYILGVIYNGCSLANCASSTTDWQTYSTINPAPLPPTSFPLQVIDASGQLIVFNQLSDIPMCNNCTPPNLVLDNQIVCDPITVDLNTAINVASDPGNSTFYNSQADANGGVNSIVPVVLISGTYWVRHEDPLDPNCFTVSSVYVTINPIYNSVENVTVCENQQVTYPDGVVEIITASASYTSNLTTVAGCDSIIVTNVMMNPNLSNSETITLCAGSNYTYPDGTVSSNIVVNESHVSNLVTVSGCDSIITTNLAINSTAAISESITLCLGANYTYPDGITSSNILVNETHISNLSTAAGCDSVITTNIIITPVIAGSNDITICPGEDVTYPDGTVSTNITVNESYVSQFVSVYGCDSLHTTNVILSPIPNIDAGVNLTVCENETVILTASGGVGYQWDNNVIDGQSFVPPVGSTVYSVTGWDTLGCENTDDVTITVSTGPVVAFVGDDLSGCTPHTVTFNNLTAGGVNCSWSFGNGMTSSDCGPVTITYDNPGSYDVTLTVTDGIGCVGTATYTDYIYVATDPLAGFTVSTSVLGPYDSEIQFTNTSSNATSYIWDFGDNSAHSTDISPIHNFPNGESGYTVTLYAENDAGCTDSVNMVITYEDELIFYVPNTFTPDGDDYNEYFQPVFTSGFDPYDFTLLVFNRWGEIIWESHNAEIGWDGTYGGNLVQDGTYTWKIEFKETMTDERHMVTGHVSIIR